MTLHQFIATRRGLLFAAYTAFLFALYVRPLQAWARLSLTDGSASHLIVVPMLTAVILYQRRREIAAAARMDVAAGFGTAACALALASSPLWLRSTVTTDALSTAIAALVGLWIAGFVLLFGRGSFAVARFPLLMLGLMVPIPTPVLNASIEMLKRGSASMVAVLFTATGTPFYREAYTFSLPKFVIEIADECSGIRSSIALLFTALLAGQMFLRTFWKQALLVAMTLPLAIVKNGVRIVSLSLLASYVDPGFLTGSLHHKGGIVFFLVSLALFAPIIHLLQRTEALSSSAWKPSARAAIGSVAQ